MTFDDICQTNQYKADGEGREGGAYAGKMCVCVCVCVWVWDTKEERCRMVDDAKSDAERIGKKRKEKMQKEKGIEGDKG